MENICDWVNSDNISIKYFDNYHTCTKITYAQLYDTSKEISRILQEAGSSQFVGIAANVPVYCVPAFMLGITLSRRTFVCLPSIIEETERISDKLNISHTFCHENLNGTSQCLNIFGKKIYFEKMKKCATEEARDNIFAYAITTSGTTGLPKIVKVTHSSILPNIHDLKKILDISETDVIAQATPLTFDPSIIEIFLSLSSKACLLTVSANVKNDPEVFLKILVDNKISVLQSTPSLLLQRWSNEKIRETLLGNSTSLRILLLGGEHFPSAKVISEIQSTGNKTRIFDIYGITEVSCWASIREVEKQDLSRKLGEGLSETILEVRNSEGKKIQEGEGILYIGSDSRVCVIDTEDLKVLKKPVFRSTGDIAEINNNGCIILKGRQDRRVKRYGTRINLADLENHIQDLPFVENCCAIFTESNQSLIMFFTVFVKSINEREKKDYEIQVLSRAKTLPAHYRLDNATFLDRFVLTSNGKICRKFLRQCTRRLTRVIENDLTRISSTFEDIWKRVLNCHQATGFLDSGGSSVMALRIANEFEEKISHKFPKLIGLLLKNETLDFCKKYISTQMAISKNEKISGNSEKSLFNEKREIFDDSLRAKKRICAGINTEEEKSRESILPWQKCRGRNNFPASRESEENKGWNHSTRITVKNRYNLGKCVDASPTIFQYPGGEEYVTVGSHAGIICTVELSKKDFLEHWQFSLPNRIEASILVTDDFKGIVGTYDCFVYCIHLKTGKIFWKFETNDIVKCTAVLCSKKKNVFIGSYDRNAYCISIEDGSEIWAEKISNGSICATPCVDDESNSVLFATLDGTCISLKQNTGEINWSYKSDYPVFSAPIILHSDFAVFCDVSGKLNLLSLMTGEKIREVEIDGNIFSHPHVRTDLGTRIQSVLLASLNKNVYKLECSMDARMIFRFVTNVEAPIASTPCSDGSVIVVAGNDGALRILDFLSGEILFNFKLNHDVFSSPIIHRDFIVVGCRDDNLYILTKYDDN